MSKKEKRTPEQKAKKRKRDLLITATVFAVLFAFIGVMALNNFFASKAALKRAASYDAVIYSAQRVPEKDVDGYYTFNSDTGIKIMQLTDVHIGGGIFSEKEDMMAINAVASMVKAEKPDLVIATGDIAYPIPFSSGTFNNMTSTRLFAELMENLGVYWTFAFGNHDTELYSYYDREAVCEFYETSGYKYCLFQRGPENVDGYGNQIIKVKNDKNLITQAVFIFDSHSYNGIKFWEYDNIHQNQVDWYEKEVLKLNAYNLSVLEKLPSGAVDPENFKTVKSLAFMHIPLVEYRDAYDEYLKNGSKDSEDVKLIYGSKNEKVCCGDGSDNLFEKMVELKSTKGIFCGHDHVNNCCFEYKGIRLSYSMSIDYLAYARIDKKGAQRGCTLIYIDDEGNFKAELSNYYQDKYKTQYEKESVSMK